MADRTKLARSHDLDVQTKCKTGVRREIENSETIATELSNLRIAIPPASTIELVT